MKKQLLFLSACLLTCLFNVALSQTITSPNGGEVWTAGNKENITWSGSGFGSSTGSVLYYSTDSGATWTMIATVASKNNTYAWTVPNTPSTTCLVRIGGTNGDVSDAVFTILGTPAGINTANINDNVKIYPNPAENNLYVENKNGISNLRLLNIIGQEIYSAKVDIATNKMMVDVSKYESGAYFLITTDNNNTTSTQKVIIR